MSSPALALSVLFLSFIVTSILIIPFINLLYKLRFQRAQQADTRDVFGALTPIFNKFHQKKAGVPVGGGLLVIGVVSILFALILPILSFAGIDVTSVYENSDVEVNILFFTFLTFAILGLYDDTKKFFKIKSEGVFGLRMQHKLLIQVVLAVIISLMLYLQLGISFINIPFFGIVELSWLYVPFATFTIVAFANAVNFTDGLDGLASGVLMISLFGLWFLSATILDVPLAIFIALWLGSLISFLYFNVFPARIFMGDVGSLAFGATLAVVGLLLGKVLALVVIGFVFVLEIFSAALQLTSKKVFKKKLIPAAPFHLTLQQYGWEEPKIVQRTWLVQVLLTLFGIWLTFL